MNCYFQTVVKEGKKFSCDLVLDESTSCVQISIKAITCNML